MSDLPRLTSQDVAALYAMNPRRRALYLDALAAQQNIAMPGPASAPVSVVHQSFCGGSIKITTTIWERE